MSATEELKIPNRDTVVIIPIRLAVYCENCKQITNSPGEICVGCDSKGALINLGRLLETGDQS